MAIALVTTGTGGEEGGATPFTVTLGASPSANDVILVFVSFNNTTSGSHPVPSITDFTSLGTSTASVWERMTCLWKAATGSEGTSLSVTFTGNDDFSCGGAIVLSGCDTAQPTNIVTTPDASSNTTASIPAITTAANNSWDVAAVCFGGNNSYNASNNYASWGSSLTERVDHAAPLNGALETYAGVGIATALRATAGSQAATSVTQSVSDVSGAIRVEIKEATAATTSLPPIYVPSRATRAMLRR